MSFLKDYKKYVAPSVDQGTGASGAPEDKNSPGSDPGVTLQDMKDYFEAMKKGLLDDFRKEIAELQKKPDPDQNPESEEGGNE